MPPGIKWAPLHDMVPMSRAAVLGLYLTSVIVLMGAGASETLSRSTGDFTFPFFHFDVVAILLSAFVCAGLCCAGIRLPSRLSAIGTIAAGTTAAYALSALALTAFLSWIDFTGRANYGRETQFVTSLQGFALAHSPTNSIGMACFTLLLLTPIALIALPAVFWYVGSWRVAGPLVTHRLALLILVASLPCSAFALGAFMAQNRTSFGGQSVGVGLLQVIALGAISAWMIARLLSPSLAKVVHPDGPSATEVGAALASVSKTSTVALVLIYFSVSQLSGYTNRVLDLIEARHAFAADIVDTFAPDDATASKISPGRHLFSHEWWASIYVTREEADKGVYIVEVRQNANEGTWSVFVRQIADNQRSQNRTQLLADRDGLDYKSANTAVTIFPRLAAYLRAKDVDIPGAGVSIDLTNFTLIAPLVIFAIMTLLADRAQTAVEYHPGPAENLPFLLHPKSRLSGLVGWLWVAAIAGGPWILAIIVVQALTLTLRAKGTLETYGLDTIATGYVILTFALLLLPTWSASKSLFLLRTLAGERRPDSARPTHVR